VPNLRITILVCGVCLVSCCLNGQVTGRLGQVGTDVPCGSFVQQFYDWYVPIALKGNSNEPPWDVALRVRSSLFSQDMASALKKEEAIQAKVQDAGIDADPFLNSQDPAEKYVVGTVRVDASHCRVDVYGIYSGRRSEKPEVYPELALEDGHWVFVNFGYHTGDLLTLLKNLRKRGIAH
jgi:hypothetical protein